RQQVGPRDVSGRVPLPGHGLLVVALEVVGPDFALAVDVGLEVGEPVGLLCAPWREAPVLADQLGHLREAVSTDVEVTEGEATALVLRPAAHPLAGSIEPRQVEVALQPPLEAVEKRPVVAGIGGGEGAPVPLLLAASTRRGGVDPSGYAKSMPAERSKNSWMLSAKR